MGAMKSNDHFFDDEEGSDNGGSRLQAGEVISRVFQWVADGKTLDDCGFRSIVALACVRPDLFKGATLEQLGLRAGRQRQAVWKLKQDFLKTTGY
jgi:hypothetical protein